jgi:FMN phosphatase YigB (HAD superfamily)
VKYVQDGLRELGIHELFDVVIVSSDVGINKPDEEIFALT